MRIHFIAIGGAIMHQLAIELHRNGNEVTGSDDEIFEPAKTNLHQYRLLPDTTGWFPERINENLDAVILGMHAREDNPELQRARALGLKIYSFPEYIYEFSKNKKRIVIAGSHGKTSTTSMVMHVLQKANIPFDFLVGAKVPGFDRSVQLSDAQYIILEGDEYPASALNKIPKIHYYHPHISVLTGIEWDHINVFPTYENYVGQFRHYLQQMQEQDAKLIYCSADDEVVKLVQEFSDKLSIHPYTTPQYSIGKEEVLVEHSEEAYPVSVFGAHNLQNMEAARLVCAELGVSAEDFYKNIADFEGAARRLEKVHEDDQRIIFRDFAHAPSKVRATLKAVRERYPNHILIACLELHTFSSLNADFHAEYESTLIPADKAAVYFSKHALTLKRLPLLDSEQLKQSFVQQDLDVYSDPEAIQKWIEEQLDTDKPTCLLMMSSGTFDGLDLTQFFGS